MILRTFSIVSLLLFGAILAGCGSAPTAKSPAGPPDQDYLLAEAPADALPVADIRSAAQDGEEAVVVGRIGGSEAPFVEGVAAFTLVDPALKPCPVEENCPTPWDYCCDANLLKKNVALVKVVDGEGSPVGRDARQLLGVKELDTVMARGKVERDEAGNVTLLATKIYVVPQ